MQSNPTVPLFASQLGRVRPLISYLSGEDASQDSMSSQPAGTKNEIWLLGERQFGQVRITGIVTGVSSDSKIVMIDDGTGMVRAKTKSIARDFKWTPGSLVCIVGRIERGVNSVLAVRYMI